MKHMKKLFTSAVLGVALVSGINASQPAESNVHITLQGLTGSILEKHRYGINYELHFNPDGSYTFVEYIESSEGGKYEYFEDSQSGNIEQSSSGRYTLKNDNLGVFGSLELQILGEKDLNVVLFDGADEITFNDANTEWYKI